MSENNTLDDLKRLLASFSAADVKKALAEAAANKPTMLSCTCEALVTAQLAGPVLTDSVTKATTALAREVGILKSDENANGSSVGQIIRICVAHDAAMVHAGYEWNKKPVEPVAEVTAPALPVANGIGVFLTNVAQTNGTKLPKAPAQSVAA